MNSNQNFIQVLNIVSKFVFVLLVLATLGVYVDNLSLQHNGQWSLSVWNSYIPTQPQSPYEMALFAVLFALVCLPSVRVFLATRLYFKQQEKTLGVLSAVVLALLVASVFLGAGER